jgi:hypothetical protein
VVTALAVVFLVGWATLLVAALARVVDGLERRRLRRVAAQVRVTETVHHALGAVVAPTVTWHRGQPSTIRMVSGHGTYGWPGSSSSSRGGHWARWATECGSCSRQARSKALPSNAWCPDDRTREPAGSRRAEWAGGRSASE